MSLAALLRSKSEQFGMCHGFQPVYFHTGTIYDFEAGRLSRGVNDSFLIGGGYGNFVTAAQGANNTFKTTLILSNLLRMLSIYPDANLVIVDTEGSIVANLERLIRLSDRKDREILERIHPIDGRQHSIGGIYRILKNICEEREKLGKDLWVESPFVNLETKQKIKTRKPLIFLIDSVSKLISSESQDLIDKDGLDGDKIATVNMTNGNRKSIFMDQVSILCAKYGVGFVLTAWVGGIIDMNPRAPKLGKQFTESRHGEKSKGTSTSYDYLIHVAYQIMNSSVYWADDKKKDACRYPYDEYTLPKDLHQVTLKFLRSKINMSGNDISPFVMAQRDGLQPHLTALDYLKTNENYGLNLSGSHGSTMALQLMPEEKHTRMTIRKALDTNYEMQRALEITYQLHYVQTYWRHFIQEKYPVIYNPEEVYNKFIAKESSIKIQDILNSRGYWTYDTKNKRKEMNIFQIMDLLGKK